MLDTQYFPQQSTNHLVLRAAMVQFSSYGYQRTSMGSIAKQAGVSRPTLYSYFENKQAILYAVSQGIHDTTIQNIKRSLGSAESLEQRLCSAFEAWSAPFQSILFGSAHGAELIGAGSALAADVTESSRAAFHRLLVGMLKKEKRAGVIELSVLNLTFTNAADFLILSLNGLSADQTDEATYRHRLLTLVRMFLSAVNHKPTS